MEGCPKNSEICPKLLNLISRDRKWYDDEKSRQGCYNTEKQLELRLGPPGGDQDRVAVKNPETRTNGKNNMNTRHELDDKSMFALGNDFSRSSTTNNAIDVPRSSQKRIAPCPVVGWPPVRSFRKNLASSSSSKAGNVSSNGGQDRSDAEKPVEAKAKGLFVKINMDGVPIGRKVDLNAYKSYDQLSSAVDKLFRGLLAAQRDSSNGGKNQSEEKAIAGLLDGKGEYTLTYEDNEGDKMLVGDVPWRMFVSSVKRLRVIKSSEVSCSVTYGNIKQDNTRK